MVKRILIHVMMGLVLGLIFVFANNTDLFRKVELSLYNTRFEVRGPHDASKDVLILTIDDASFNEMKDTPWPWDRGIYVNILEQLHKYGAKFVAMDVMFVTRGQSDEGDKKFFDTLTRYKDSTMVASKFEEGQTAKVGGAGDKTEEGEINENISYSTPFEFIELDDEPEPDESSVEEVTSDDPASEDGVDDASADEPASEDGADDANADDPASEDGADDTIAEEPMAEEAIDEPTFGFVNFYIDLDHQIRKGQLVKDMKLLDAIPTSMTINDQWEPGFTFQIVNKLYPKKAKALLEKYKDNPIGIDFAGPPRSYNTLSFFILHQYGQGLINDEQFEGLAGGKPNEIFKDKIVLIGATATALHDNFAAPFTASVAELIPGVEIHANMLDTIRNDTPYFPISIWVNIAIILIFAIGASLALAFLKTVSGLIFIASLSSLFAVVNILIFNTQRIFIDMFSPIVVLILAYGVVYAYRFLVEDKEKRRVRRFFKSYVSPQLVEELLKDPKNMPSLKSERKMVTILFSDIAGFTSMSERLPPDEVEHILNEYLTAMSEIVFGNDGTLDKYIGDAVMALWGNLGVNNPMEDAFKAVNTALQMQKKLSELREKWLQEGMVPLQVRIGLNTGEALVGNFGSPQKMDYTVIGDAVNTAARLEGMNKNVGTSILISQSTYDLVRDRIQANNKGVVKVKGKEEGVGIFEVVGWKESAASKSTGMMDTKWMQTSIGKETNWQ